MSGIPVMIHLDGETFRKLEAIAQRKGTTMRELIESSVARGIQHKPQRAAGQVPAPKRTEKIRGWKRLDAEEWAECLRLRRLGWSVPELAVRFGCSSSAIYFRMRREQQ